ncbi:AraC family transcriptional regulator [Bifidobacterium primatium]|uniref:AraC family transcriptional regulator n=1 Tax=Bifidobacterium primatium TaxID=2045438 RepID=UPI0013FD2EDC|nr:AraC family transcriptional regulator [Bifidobacterium primatium]
MTDGVHDDDAVRGNAVRGGGVPAGAVPPTNPLTIFSDLSERPQYNLPGLPLYGRRDDLRRFGYRIVCHWHRDFEFIHVVAGETMLVVNGETRRMRAGEGVFINSRRLHYLFSDERKDCRFVTAMVDPVFFGGLWPNLANAMLDRMGDGMVDYVMLTADEPVDRELLFGIDEFARTMGDCARDGLRALDAASQAAALCSRALERVARKPLSDDSAESGGAGSDDMPGPSGLSGPRGVTGKSNPGGRRTVSRPDSLHAFLVMVAFIRSNVASKITLDDIAHAGLVGRRACCEQFRRHAGRTPNDYLTDYRIGRSRELLVGGDMTVGEIAAACGFSSSAYFGYVFRRRMGCSPSEYRARERG